MNDFSVTPIKKYDACNLLGDIIIRTELEINNADEGSEEYKNLVFILNVLTATSNAVDIDYMISSHSLRDSKSMEFLEDVMDLEVL